MKSHEYEFRLKDVLRLAGLPLLGLCAFALFCRVGVMSGFFPPPHPTLDADRTILAHQAEASRRQTAAFLNSAAHALGRNGTKKCHR